MVIDDLHATLASRILVLDGAMGTRLQARGLSEAEVRGARFRSQTRELRDNYDLLTLTQPALVREVHRDYLAAGADIITTNTFRSTAIAQAQYGLGAIAYELNVAAAQLARAAADEWTRKTPERPRLVAGAIGPASRALSLSTTRDDPASRLAFAAVRNAYRDQVRGLLDGGVDLLLVETILDTRNAQAAIAAILDERAARAMDVPMMISVTVTEGSNRLLSGEPLDAFYASIRQARPFSVGVNCGCGAGQMRPAVADLARVAEAYVSCHPNAGLPDALGDYDERPAHTAAVLRELAVSGLVNIVGGCCGTTPEHIRAIAGAVAGVAPRQLRRR